MLSRFDDYPIHQTPEPIAHVATSDRNAYDRYWFNGYAEDGEFYFGVAMAIYPNLRILDGAFSIVNVVESSLGSWLASPPKLALAVAVPAFVLSEYVTGVTA